MTITKKNLSNAQYNQYCFIGGIYCEDYPTCKESIFLDIEDNYEEHIGILIKPSLLDKALEFWKEYKLPKLNFKREVHGSFCLIEVDFYDNVFKHYVFIDIFIMCIKAAKTGKEILIDGIQEYADWGEIYKKYLSYSNLQLKKLISNDDVMIAPGLADIYFDFEQKANGEGAKGKRKL